MTLYSIVFLTITLLAMLSGGRLSSRSKGVIFWGCAIGLIVLSAIRDFSVGADTLNYCQGFQYIRIRSFKDALSFGWEQGYVITNWLLGRFFKNSRALLVFMAAFILLPIFYWIKKKSKWPVLSLLIFVGMGMWSASMFILRQWCAMAILTFSYKYIREQKFIPFLILVLIAMLFHRTAAIFLLAYFVMNIRLDTAKIFLSIPISAAVGMLGGRILNILNRFARISEAGNFNGGITILVVFWLCIIACIVCFKGVVPQTLDFYFRLVFFAAFLQPISFTFSNWSRIVTYFSIALPVFLPNFVMELTGPGTRNRKLRLPLGITICILMFIWFKIAEPDLYVFMPF